MKRISIILILVMTFFGLQAQTTTYYKSSKFKKEVPKNKAKYKIVRFTKKDTVVFQAYKIKGNRFLTDIKTLNNRPTGIWLKYDKYGNLIYRKDFSELVYSDGSIKNIRELKKSNPKSKFLKVAHFPGGLQGLMQFLTTHIKYPEVSKALHHSGIVFIRFIIKKDGTAVPYSIVKEADPFFDLEAWQVIKEMPKWIPARMEGKPVVSVFNLPVKFTMN